MAQKKSSNARAKSAATKTSSGATPKSSILRAPSRDSTRAKAASAAKSAKIAKPTNTAKPSNTAKFSTTAKSLNDAQSANAAKQKSPRYWLMKSEADCFGFDHLWNVPGKRTGWDGVRNYQARNFIRDSMSIGDLVLYYHSNAEPSGIAGIARVASAAYPDPTQFDPSAEHFDPKSKREDPPWMQVDIEAVAKLPRFVSLQDLKRDPRLARMLVLQRGQRLSVLPVEAGEWRVVLELAGLDPADL